MLSRLLGWLRGDDEPEPRLDAVALDVARRQRRVEQKLAKMTGHTPEELLDYRRADDLWARHK